MIMAQWCNDTGGVHLRLCHNAVAHVLLAVAAGGKQYLGIGGRELALPLGDTCIHDAAGIISSVLYGPDHRTQIPPHTR